MVDNPPRTLTIRNPQLMAMRADCRHRPRLRQPRTSPLRRRRSSKLTYSRAALLNGGVSTSLFSHTIDLSRASRTVRYVQHDIHPSRAKYKSRCQRRPAFRRGPGAPSQTSRASKQPLHGQISNNPHQINTLQAAPEKPPPSKTPFTDLK